MHWKEFFWLSFSKLPLMNKLPRCSKQEHLNQMTHYLYSCFKLNYTIICQDIHNIIHCTGKKTKYFCIKFNKLSICMTLVKLNIGHTMYVLYVLLKVAPNILFNLIYFSPFPWLFFSLQSREKNGKRGLN